MRLPIALTVSALLVAACACPPGARLAGPEHCYKCEPGTRGTYQPAAPGPGSVVLSRDSLYPVRVRYINLPYIDAGAVMQIPGPEHVLTRQFPSDNHYDHTWNGQSSTAPATIPGRPYILQNQTPPTTPAPPAGVELPPTVSEGGLPPPVASIKQAAPVTTPSSTPRKVERDDTPAPAPQLPICKADEHEDSGKCREMGS
ncbi:MAG: hypothetical protein E6Q76_14455 [Rhizobium sp.]|nr:MAG: hypothetical protein E6Q76_14455 [Rhizobium sp.]